MTQEPDRENQRTQFGLAPGTYYFAVVAFNTAGDDSPESNVASKTI